MLVTDASSTPSTLTDHAYLYDAMGNQVYDANMGDEFYYLYDAHNTLLAKYVKQSAYGPAGTMAVTERYVYGTDRLCTWYGENGWYASIASTGYAAYTVTGPPGYKMRHYELHDHLGNLRATVEASLPTATGSAWPVKYYNYYAFGSPQPYRVFDNASPSTATFGFNGQERKDDYKGKGNHNHALYWEYDTRIGRRWNMDPVIKPHRSPYDVFDNSPIWKLDPNGDDDFFNSKGEFVGHTNTGTKIRIQTDQGDVLFGSQFLSNKAVSPMQKAVVALGVANYYASQASVKGTVALAYDPVRPESPAHTAGGVGGQVRINFWFDPTKFKNYDDNGNVINTLYHEGDHQRNEISDFASHAKTYLNQLLDKSFTTGTTDEYKNGMVGSFAAHVLNAYVNDPNREPAVDMVNKFNAENKAGYRIVLNEGIGNAANSSIEIIYKGKKYAPIQYKDVKKTDPNE